MNTFKFRKYGLAPYKTAVLHGGPGAAGSLAPLAIDIASSHSVIEAIQRANTIQGQLDELKLVLDEHAALPINLIGHSWGAMLGFLFSAYYPTYIKKLIMIGSGVFAAKYVKKIMLNRSRRLSQEQQIEIRRLIDGLNNNTVNLDVSFSHLGEIFAEVDSFDPIEPIKLESLPGQYNIYQNVWPQMEKLRATPELLLLGKQIICPVIAIHGDYDPHPYLGIKEPLMKVVKNFKFILLEKCGHYPWLERQAREKFFKIINYELN